MAVMPFAQTRPVDFHALVNQDTPVIPMLIVTISMNVPTIEAFVDENLNVKTLPEHLNAHASTELLMIR